MVEIIRNSRIINEYKHISQIKKFKERITQLQIAIKVFAKQNKTIVIKKKISIIGKGVIVTIIVVEKVYFSIKKKQKSNKKK